MRVARHDLGERAGAAIGAAAVQALLLYVLATGLGVRVAAPEQRPAQLVDFSLPPPPQPQVIEEPARRPRAQGAAAPPNKVSRASEIAASPQVLPMPEPVIAAPKPATGSDASSGNALVAGPGTGAGGAGNGTGSGGAGNGAGSGGTVLRLLRGDITGRDYPKAAARAGAQGTVHLRFTVGVDGRVSDCIVTQSSGNADLDATTCRLIRKRFRYAPSRDAQGRPYADVVTGEQVWELYDRPGRERDGDSTDD